MRCFRQVSILSTDLARSAAWPGSAVHRTDSFPRPRPSDLAVLDRLEPAQVHPLLAARSAVRPRVLRQLAVFLVGDRAQATRCPRFTQDDGGGRGRTTAVSVTALRSCSGRKNGGSARCSAVRFSLSCRRSAHWAMGVERTLADTTAVARPVRAVERGGRVAAQRVEGGVRGAFEGDRADPSGQRVGDFPVAGDAGGTGVVRRRTSRSR